MTSAFQTSGRIPATAEQVFAAFEPERLVGWRDPDGQDYRNECVFAESVVPSKDQNLARLEAEVLL